MATTTEKPKGGLETLVVTASSICYLDGEKGVLAYCCSRHSRPGQGRDVRGGLLPVVAPAPAHAGGAGRSAVAAGRGAAHSRPIVRLMRSLPAVDGMDALRTITSARWRTTTPRPTTRRPRPSIARPCA